MATTRKYGWRKDKEDPRDFKYRSALFGSLPAYVDLRPFCSPVYDQSTLGACHDDKTEVLTYFGWKLFKDLTEEDSLASVDPFSKKLIYEKPTRLIRYEYDGPMHYGLHQRVDFAVTPDHNMLVRKWDQSARTLSDDYTFVAIKDIGWASGLMTGVVYSSGSSETATFNIKSVAERTDPGKRSLMFRPPKDLPMDAWCQLLGLYLAEGTMIKKYKFQIAAVKEREKSYTRDLLTKLGINACELKDRFTFQDKQLHAAFCELGLDGVKAPYKFVPEFVFHLDASHMKDVLLGHFMGDGCENEGTRSHYTSSKQLADDLQRLILLSGGWSNIGERPPRESVIRGRVIKGRFPEYRVGQWASSRLSLDRMDCISIEDYKGEVFCAEVPTYHTLITRRNKKILISGNCSSMALAGLIEYHEIIQKKVSPYIPSRLFIYYNERVIENTVEEDAGASMRDGIKAIARWGYCDEALWPYDIQKFAMAPPLDVYSAAKTQCIVNYYRLDQKLHDMQTCLASGHPFVFGFQAFSNLEKQAVANTGVLNMPHFWDSIIGGHAVMCVGYDNSCERFIVRNSWGSGWGMDGYFTMPFKYLLSPNLAADFWAINQIP